VVKNVFSRTDRSIQINPVKKKKKKKKKRKKEKENIDCETRLKYCLFQTYTHINY
jgi:hypothetical protein